MAQQQILQVLRICLLSASGDVFLLKSSFTTSFSLPVQYFSNAFSICESKCHLCLFYFCFILVADAECLVSFVYSFRPENFPSIQKRRQIVSYDDLCRAESVLAANSTAAVMNKLS